MTETEALLQAIVALQLILLGTHHPGLASKLRRSGYLLLAAGAVLPLLDYLGAHLFSQDRIGVFTFGHLFYGIYPSLLTIGALGLLRIGLRNFKEALRGMALVGTGMTMHLLLGVLTPTGVPLLAPFSNEMIALGILPSGHPLLVATLTLVLVMMEWTPPSRARLFKATVFLLFFYVLAGVGQHGYFYYQTQKTVKATDEVWVLPNNAFMTDWRVVVHSSTQYDLWRVNLLNPRPAGREQVPQWNDETLLVRLLSDPIVSHFYHEVFQHPLVEIVDTGTQLKLTLQEVTAIREEEGGRTFYAEIDHQGNDRFYQLQRFN